MTHFGYVVREFWSSLGENSAAPKWQVAPIYSLHQGALPSGHLLTLVLYDLEWKMKKWTLGDEVAHEVD